MHPLTNYREHPVDNALYAIGLGASTGLVAASVSALLGYVPSEPTVLGVGIFVVAYNGLGTTCDIRTSGCAGRDRSSTCSDPLRIIRCITATIRPTSTRISRSCFLCGILIFGTFQVPQTNADVKFGLSDREEEEFTSCMGLYFAPFRNAVRLFVPEHRRMLQREEPAHPEGS